MNELGSIVLEVAARATALTFLGLLAMLVLRRRGPSAGALAGSTTLAVLVGLSAMAFSPWPCWWSPDLAQPIRGAAPTVARPLAASTPPLKSSGTARPAPVVGPSTDLARAGWSDFVQEFARNLDRTPEAARAPGWRWPAWAACGFLIGLAVGLVRLGLGLWAVRTLRDRSRAVDDPALWELADRLRSEMGLHRSVDLRESTEVATPATIGWRRPAVLLPVNWREWDDLERRAVLAHELAHVVRGDYLSGLLAQLSLSIHFYHPLVHALSRRLRLDQELAADAWGARLSGGRRPYLTALANLALRQDPRPAAWPARPFLPTRGTFLRRIEMLRDPKALQQPPMPLRARFLTVVGLTLAGLAVAGFRGPVGSTPTLAQDAPIAKAAATAQAPPPLDPSSCSSDIHLVLDIRPLAILKNPELKKLADQFRGAGPKELAAVLSGDIEQLLMLVTDRQPGNGTFPQVVVMRSTRPYDWKPLMGPKVEEVKADGISYFRPIAMPKAVCYRVLDDRTFLIGTEADVKVPPIGLDRPRGRHGWDDAWKKLSPGAIRVAFDTPWLARQVLPNPPAPANRPGAFSPMMSLLGPLLEKTQAYGISFDAPDGLTLDGLATCGTEENAARVADTLRAYLTLGRNAIPDLRKAAEGGFLGGSRGLVEAVDALETSLETTRVDQDKLVAGLHAKADPAFVATVPKMLLLPAMQAQREAAGRAQSINNLKQIALAMHNFASANESFPPAVLYGPDGKTPYSWRVALLPFLGANDLYAEYKFNEPWDGPNNLKLLDRMPAVYACPSDPQAIAAHQTSYFVLTGPVTLFPEQKNGMEIKSITDGTSSTLMVVESRQATPWTKPEDIPYAKDKPLPTLGKLYPGGFNAATADGAVRFYKDSINETTLRAMISRNGGEVFPADDF